MHDSQTDLAQRLQALEDRNTIHEMTSQFADAANRVDPDAFMALWAVDAVWQIGPPIDKEFISHDPIREAFLGLLCHAWEFFIQMPSAHVIQVTGDTATARSFVNEIARAKDGTANYNLAVYEDELARSDQGWRFTKRTYKVLYLDTSPMAGTAYQRAVL